jgi:hypothetical protein
MTSGLSKAQQKANGDLLARLDASPTGDALVELAEEFFAGFVPPGHNQAAYSTHCTPLLTARYVVDVAQPCKDDRCLDLCAGLGIFAYALVDGGVTPEQITAVELASTLYGIGSRLTPEVAWVQGNAFEVAFWEPYTGVFDLVIGNPPWGQSKGRTPYAPGDTRFGPLLLAGDGNGTAPAIAEAMALEVALRVLRPGGRGAFLLPPTAFQGPAWQRYERELARFEAKRRVKVIDVDFATAGQSAALVQIWRGEEPFDFQPSLHPVPVVPSQEAPDPIARMTTVMQALATPGIDPEKMNLYQPRVQKLAQNELCVKMGFSSVLASFASAFDLIEIIEEEILAAIERHGLAKALDLDNCFSMIDIGPFGDFNPALFRAHTIELLERVAAGEDTRPATAAEVWLGLMVSLETLSPEQMILAFRLCAQVAPGFAARMERDTGVDFAEDCQRAVLGRYPDTDPGEADVLWYKFRQDLAVADRVLREDKYLSGVFLHHLEDTFSHSPEDVAAVRGLIDYLHGREQELRARLSELTPGVEPWGEVREELRSFAWRRADLLRVLGEPTGDADRVAEECSRPVAARPVEAPGEPASPAVIPPAAPVQLSLVLEI